MDVDVHSSEITDDRRSWRRRRLGSAASGTDRTKKDQQCETGQDLAPHAIHHISGIIERCRHSRVPRVEDVVAIGYRVPRVEYPV